MDVGRFFMRQAIALALVILFFTVTTSAHASDSPPASLSASSTDVPSQKPRPTIQRDLFYKVEGTPSGPRAPHLTGNDYPEVLGESRLIIWIVAQQHLYWVAFVLGTLCIATLLEIWTQIGPRHHRTGACDALARECLDLVMVTVAIAGILGALLLISLLALYPDLTSYLMSVFRPVLLVYGALIPVFTLLSYLYYVSWLPMSEGVGKWLHMSLGILVNVVGTTIAFLGNAWSSFMLAPAGVDDAGRYLGNSWHLIHSAVWNASNLHRFAGHLLCASAVLCAYAIYRALASVNEQERAHYDWMGAVAAGFLVGALFTMPFGGYWLMRETYAYRQQMGITLLGGLLAWLGIVLVSVMGLVLLGINYYLWQRIDTLRERQSFAAASKWVYLLLGLCVVVYITPHTMMMTPLEFKHLGGQQHQVLGNYGVESAKSAAINLMMLITAWSFLIWRLSQGSVTDRSDLVPAVTAVFVVAGLNILWLGIYGYYIPANVRVGLSVPMVATTATILVLALILAARYGGSTPGWGKLSRRGYFGLLAVSCLVIWAMALGGYRRSAVRLFWHVNEIMSDESPWSFTHTTGFAVNVISFNALLFSISVSAVMWLAKAVPYRRGLTEARSGRSEVVTHSR